MWRRKSPLGRGETQRWGIALTKESYPLGESTAQFVEARPPPPEIRPGAHCMWGPTEKFLEISKFPQTTAHQDADALHPFKSRGFGGEIGVVTLPV